MLPSVTMLGRVLAGSVQDVVVWQQVKAYTLRISTPAEKNQSALI